MIIARRSFLGLIGVTLSGCMVGPDYLKPDVAAPDTFRYQIKTGKAYANESWWQLFSDPVLHRLVNQSLAQNWDITIATARATLSETDSRLVSASTASLGFAAISCCALARTCTNFKPTSGCCFRNAGRAP